jgi:GNAT superfamily N-acetyltransferase
VARKALSVDFADGIEQLARNHDRRAFTCGVAALDEYLRRFARQHAAANISRTYVAVAGTDIRGYYTLAMAGIRRDNLPPRHADRFPNFPLPVARLARLAVARQYQRQGLGELLLADALQRCLHLSDEIGMAGVIVDARTNARAGGTSAMSSSDSPSRP